MVFKIVSTELGGAGILISFAKIDYEGSFTCSSGLFIEDIFFDFLKEDY